MAKVRNYPVKIFAITLLVVLAAFLISFQSFAQETESSGSSVVVDGEKKAIGIEWALHKSFTGIFDAKFPKEYQYNIFPFQINKETVPMSVEILATLDDGVIRKHTKSVFIKATQTWGEELSLQEMKKVLKDSVKKYLSTANDSETFVVSNEDINHKGFFGKDLYITYKENDNKYGLRIRIYTTNYAKVEQVLSGPADTMYSYRSDDFFNSLTLYDGITKSKGELGYGWVEHASDNNIFTVKVPPVNKDYTPVEPIFRSSPKREQMRYTILDPVTSRDAFYNISVYKASSRFTYNAVRKLLLTNHIAKFVENAGNQEDLSTQNTVVDDVNIIRTRLVISPIESLPDINTIIYEARYSGGTLLIQEFLCHNSHADSGLSNTLFSLLKFHPEKYELGVNKRDDSEDMKDDE